MAEYKNGFNYRGNMSVDKEDYSPDVKTGRAVFVDEDKYTNDTAYKAKVDKCVEQGFHRISDAEASQSGGTEPLIIRTTEEEVKTPDNKVLGYKTDTLASDAYEAWQNGRPIYRNINGDEWAVSGVSEENVVIIYWQSDGAQVGAARDLLSPTPFSGDYLVELGVPERP